MILVVDASAIAAVMLGEPEGATIQAHCEGETLLAPQLIDYELASAAWKRIRRYPSSAPLVLGMLSQLSSLAITRVPAPPLDVAALALRTGLSAYDAAYLWLALARDAELVTLDRRLARTNQKLRERHV